MGNTSPRPGIILVPVSTELLADLGKWSPPVEVMIDEDGDSWEMAVRISGRITELTECLESLLDYADRHRVSHIDNDCGCGDGPNHCYERWAIERDHARCLIADQVEP